MLTELSVTNFKSWREIAKMRLAPITGLFGANSSGKTSILQLLLMLKQTVESSDRAQALIFGDERTQTNLGSFYDVIHAHSLPGSIRLELSWCSRTPIVVTGTDVEETVLLSGDALTFSADVIGNKEGRPHVGRMVYELQGHSFGMRCTDAEGQRYELATEGPEVKLDRRVGRPLLSLPPPVKCYGFPDQVRAAFQNADFLSDLQLAFEELFGGVYYLGPLREWPKREYPWAQAEPAAMGLRGERVVEAILAARDKGKKVSPRPRSKKVPLEQYVAAKLQELGLVSDFCVEKIADRLYKVRVRKSPASVEVLLPDVGFGVSQILPALVLCYYVPEGSTILLEQPEIHLHPSVQAGLADIFIDAAVNHNVQVIFESHSEYLVRRLQRRIAEGKLDPGKAALYFCELDNGASTLTPLDVDLYGHIKNWPKDFFGAEFSEVVEASLSAMKRRGAAGQ